MCAWLQLKLVRFQPWDTLGRCCVCADAPKRYKIKGMNSWGMVGERAGSVSTQHFVAVEEQVGNGGQQDVGGVSLCWGET